MIPKKWLNECGTARQCPGGGASENAGLRPAVSDIDALMLVGSSKGFGVAVCPALKPHRHAYFWAAVSLLEGVPIAARDDQSIRH